MKAPKAPAMLPNAKWCIDSNTVRRYRFVLDTTWSAASDAVLAASSPSAKALCHDESTTLAKLLRDSRPDGASSPAKWKRMSASMGVNNENLVIRAASLRKSVRVIFPSSLLRVAFRTMRSTTSSSRMTFWNARIFAYEILLPDEILQRVWRLSRMWSDSLCFAVSRIMRRKSSGSM